MQSTPTIAVLTDVYKNYQKILVDTVTATLIEAGYACICLSGREITNPTEKPDQASYSNKIYQLIHSQVFDGIISLSGNIGHRTDRNSLSEFINQFDLPKVSLGLELNACDSVSIEDSQGMHDIVKHLINDCGSRRFVYLRGYANDPYSQKREAIFRQVLSEHNLTVDESLMVRGNYDTFESYMAIEQLLLDKRQFDAIICANDLMAISAARALTANQVHIPRQVVITGFDDTQEATKLLPALTTVRQPIVEMAVTGTRLLIDKIENNKPNTNTHKTVSSTLIRRASTANIVKRFDSDTSQKLNVQQRLLSGMVGLEKPSDCDLQVIAEAFQQLLEGNTTSLADLLINNIQQSQNAIDQIHWWESLCFQFEEIANDYLDPGNKENHQAFRAEMFSIKEVIWSTRTEHEFNIQRMHDMQSNVLITISSSNCIEEICSALDRWIEFAGIKRLFLCAYTKPGQGVQPKSQLLFGHVEGLPKPKDGQMFSSHSILPPTLEHELHQGLLIVNPVFAGGLHMGYLLFDPSDVNTPIGDMLAQSIAYALRGQYLIEEHKKDAKQLSLINARLENAAYHDSLTGLPNRSYLQNHLNKLCSKTYQELDQSYIIMFIDLDGFKLVNDSMGHDVGDDLLCLVSGRLRVTASVHPDNELLITRIGGDEFIIVAREVDAPSSVDVILGRILDSISEPYLLENESVKISASIGCSRLPKDSTDPTLLIKQADTAMYRAKLSGKNGYSFYTQDLNIHDSSSIRISHEMETAISKNEFDIHFQPRVCANTGKVIAAEALTRWTQIDEQGNQTSIRPDVFIPIAEKAGLIVELDLYALQASCKAISSWQSKGLSLAVSVNLSTYTLNHPDCVPRILKCLEDTETDVSKIEIEVTESGMMEDIETYISKLSMLRDAGIKVALDDFGTGYSCLSYLSVLPLDVIKIDKSFIRELLKEQENPGVNHKVLQSIAAMGKELNMTVVAEGVETPYQATCLKRMHCDQLQGFLYSPAVPEAQLMDLIQDLSQAA